MESILGGWGAFKGVGEHLREVWGAFKGGVGSI